MPSRVGSGTFFDLSPWAGEEVSSVTDLWDPCLTWLSTALPPHESRSAGHPRSRRSPASSSGCVGGLLRILAPSAFSSCDNQSYRSRER